MGVSAQDIVIMAATIWGEARGEPYQGKFAVACVIMNRLNRPGWWSRQPADGVPDDTIAAVCVDPMQFSCWNKSDPQSGRVRQRAVNAQACLGDFAYRQCLLAALEAVDRVIEDPTKGSTHYHTKDVFPQWALRKSPVVAIGHHLFYNNIN